MNLIRSFLEQITLAQVATWALVVLAAGFIGQFGRKFAEYLMERAKRKKIEKPSPGNGSDKAKIAGADKAEPSPGNDPSGVTAKEAKEISKQKKKAVKALAKQNKKS